MHGHTSEEISNPLQVDLHIGHLDHVLYVRIALNNGLEYLLRYSWYNALEFLIVDIGTLKEGVLDPSAQSKSQASTIMVNVFPLPVCPYAKQVPL